MVKFISHYSGSSGNLYELQLGETKIILDPGVPFADLIRKINVDDKTLALLTHEHQDHSHSALRLIKSGIDLYSTMETLCNCRLYEYLNAKSIIKDKVFKVNDIYILPFKTFHNAMDPVGFLIKYQNYKILFCIDTSQIPYKFEGLTHIYVEANHDNNLLKENDHYGYHHMEISKSLKFVEENINPKLMDVKFLHVSKRFGDEQDFNYRLKDLLKSKINL